MMEIMKVLWVIFLAIILIIGIVLGGFVLVRLIGGIATEISKINLGESIRESISCSVRSALGGEC
jgi:ABC-type Fe3+ transport system permease subunit